MDTIEISYNLYVKYIDENKGYGVFTKEFIPKNTIVETCYCLIMGVYNTSNPTYDYIFHNKNENVYFLPFGFGSIYNHSSAPNLIWNLTENSKIIFFESLMDILPNEELTHNYGDLYLKSRKKRLL